MKFILSLTISICLLVVSQVALAQDDPCTAIPLPTPTSSNCTPTLGTTVGATKTNSIATPSCITTLQKDVWFSVVVPAGGSLIFTTTAGTMTDGVMAIYRSTGNSCSGAFTEIACNDNGINMPLISQTGLTPGETIWIRVFDYGTATGSFNICVTLPLPPPTNDDPCNAILITPGTTCNYQTYTNANTTATSGVPAPGCSSYLGGDVWFKLVVPCTGSIGLDSQTGTMTDGGMAIYSGTCNNLTLIKCDDDGSANGLMPAITQTGLTVGDTIWVRFWEYGNDNNGTFGLCATIPPPPGPGANCSSASPFCTGTVYHFPNNTNVPSLGGGGIYGCLFTTPNPVFYYFQIQNPGNLDITIVQTNTAGTALDVDFACWGPFPDLASSCGGLTANNIVDCSYSTSNTEICNITNAQVGQYYVLLLTNYSNQIGDITFQQSGGNASTNCNVICNISASNNGPVCPGQTINLNSTLNGASYSWIGPNCFSSTLQNPTGITAPTTPGSYTYTVLATTTAGENCQATTTVVVGSLANGTQTHVNPSCSGTTDGSITITPNTPGTYTYTLNPGNIVQNNNPVFTGLGVGVYTATFTNTFGCSGTVANINLTAAAPPVGTASVQNTTCPNVNDGTITVNPPTTGGPFIYTLNPGNIVQNNNPVFTGLAAGNYSVSFTTALGCVGTINNIIIANGPALVTTATTSLTSCPGVNDGTISVVPLTTGGPFTYTLNPGNIVQVNNPVFTGLAPGNYTISFISNAGCGGVVTPAPVVTAGPALVATTTVTNPPCANINDGIITIVPANPGTFTYVLTLPNNTQITQNNNPTFTGLAPGNYSYTFTNAGGCIGNGTVALVTNTPISATLSNVMPLCNGGNNGSITVNGSGGVAPYQYSLNVGTSWQSASTFTGIAAGTYPIRVKDNVGCTFDTTITVSEPTLLTASATSTPGTCNGNDGQITVTGNNGTPPYNYSVNGGINFQASPIFIVNGGPYPNIVVRDNNGCTTNTSVVVTLIDNMTIIPLNDTTICFGDSVRLIPNVSAAANVFIWNTIPIGTLINTLSNPNIKDPFATPTDTTTYTVSANWGICNRKDTITVNVLHKPIPNAGNDMAVCNYKTDTILVGSVSDTSGTVNYHWSPEATVQNPDAATTIATPSQTQVYTLTVTDNYGCGFSVTDQVVVTVQPPVPAFAGNDTIAVIGIPHQLQASGGVSYLWSPAGPLDLSSIANPLATINDDQMFVVTVTDNEGCKGNDSVFVKVYNGPTYYIPSSFTPNGDGLNDVFRPIPVGIVNTEYFRVYNRYGELVFQTTKWLNGWDGSFKGRKQTSGTYVWTIKGTDRDGKVIERKGTVVLIN